MPARHAPTSLAGQLRFIRANWGDILGTTLDELIHRLDLTVGILAEEERALHLRFGGGGGGGAGGGPGGGDGDGRPVETPSFGGAAEEPEAFSSDSAWMPRVVLMAKSTYVWLDQLSRTYGREIRTLDAIPDEELDTLARWGVTGLWLIGLWERSKASERIKRMRGNADAVASAYSLDDYRIADDLGGEEAYANLRDRAWARGIRLASDMVPNHMGIDSRWVIDHPEWFLSLPEPPYPGLHLHRPGPVARPARRDRPRGPLLGRQRRGGRLQALRPGDRRRALRLSRQRRHELPVERHRPARLPRRRGPRAGHPDDPRRRPPVPDHPLRRRDGPRQEAHPAPVVAGARARRRRSRRAPSTPSRRPSSTGGCRIEFWREVVDRVAAEVPGTLLLAEAFWLLEGYFVRTLGMHRVYNSAFMHMLRDEDGAGYRKVIKETIEFDPEILKRYVNFMSNPDEKPALEQFGKGDKYFGVATVLATLPGLPMLGHGQVQGFGEKYGMEFRRAMLDEKPDPWLVERHEREIFPLLHRRAWFAEASDFLLYDLVTPSGDVDEDVLAYSNGSGRERSLVLYHTRFASTSGTIRIVRQYAVKAADGSKRKVRRSLAEGLGLPERARRVRRLPRRADRSRVPALVRGTLGARPGRLARRLRDARLLGVPRGPRRRRRPVGPARRRGSAGAGVPSLDDAMRELQLEPIHAPFRAIFADGLTVAVLDGVATTAAARRARTTVRGVPRRRRRGDRRRRRPGRDRGPDPGGPSGRSSGWRVSAERRRLRGAGDGRRGRRDGHRTPDDGADARTADPGSTDATGRPCSRG